MRRQHAHPDLPLPDPRLDLSFKEVVKLVAGVVVVGLWAFTIAFICGLASTPVTL